MAGSLLLSGWLAGPAQASSWEERADLLPDGRRPAYRAETISANRDLERLRAELGEEGMHLLQKINRRDLRHMGRGVVLQVPDEVLPLPAFSPFPQSLDALERYLWAIEQRTRVRHAQEAAAERE